VSVSDVIGVRSPHKLQGSFLNKIKSDSVKSPLRRDSNLTKGTEGVNSPKIKVKSRISLSINDLKEDVSKLVCVYLLLVCLQIFLLLSF